MSRQRGTIQAAWEHFQITNDFAHWVSGPVTGVEEEFIEAAQAIGCTDLTRHQIMVLTDLVKSAYRLGLLHGKGAACTAK